MATLWMKQWCQNYSKAIEGMEKLTLAEFAEKIKSHEPAVVFWISEMIQNGLVMLESVCFSPAGKEVGPYGVIGENLDENRVNIAISLKPRSNEENQCPSGGGAVLSPVLFDAMKQGVTDISQLAERFGISERELEQEIAKMFIYAQIKINMIEIVRGNPR